MLGGDAGPNAPRCCTRAPGQPHKTQPCGTSPSPASSTELIYLFNRNVCKAGGDSGMKSVIPKQPSSPLRGDRSGVALRHLREVLPAWLGAGIGVQPS